MGGAVAAGAVGGGDVTGGAASGDAVAGGAVATVDVDVDVDVVAGAALGDSTAVETGLMKTSVTNQVPLALTAPIPSR